MEKQLGRHAIQLIKVQFPSSALMIEMTPPTSPPGDSKGDDAGVSTMTCVDGRRAEDARRRRLGVALAAGQRQHCWVGEMTSPRILKSGASEHSQTYGA